jgi:hypothetical protein
MRLLPYVSAIFLAMFFHPAMAVECVKPKDEPPPSISVELIPREPTYSNEKSLPEIQKMGASALTSDSHQGRAILGLTVSEINSAQRNEIWGLERGGAPLCAWLRKIKVQISFTRLDVFVAKEYKPGSCQHAAILAHENEHVAIEKEMAEQLRRETLAKLKNVEHKLISTTTRTKEEMKHFLSGILQPMLEANMAAYKERKKKAHAKIDSKESYAKVQASCKNWQKHHS